MIYLFDPTSTAALLPLGEHDTLLAFDFDGTLAPIVHKPELARMLPTTEHLFAHLCQLSPCAVVSGRARADVKSRLGSATPLYVVGNHGMEWGEDQTTHDPSLSRAHGILERELGTLPGLVIENKHHSLSIHYRQADDHDAALGNIERVLSQLAEPLRRQDGKAVINLLPVDAPHKGNALLALCERHRARHALFVGDDVTDEDAFRVTGNLTLVTVRIGRCTDSAAEYYLNEQAEIDQLLEALLALRSNLA